MLSVPRSDATFGSLLRDYRLSAGLTQKVLAERAGLSSRTVQLLEADRVRPHRATAARLAESLKLSEQDRDVLGMAVVATPRRRSALPPVTAASRRDGPRIVAVPLPARGDVDAAPTPLRTPRTAPTNVPWPVSAMIGRESDLGAIRDLIAVDRQRLVTLLGVGGSGKTCLAIEVAITVLDQFADGVWFVDLAPASRSDLVPRSVAGALGVQEIAGVSMLDTLLTYLRRKHLLLVLDNCEHLIDACAELAAQVLAACPNLQILATSREPLRIAGERRWRVQPLAVPDPKRDVPLAVLADTASVRLFVERAQAIDADFRLTETNAASVGQICTRLDGIPLAIELAASTIVMLTAEQIADRLDDCFQVLAGGARGGPTRQQTMEGALRWSYDLLTSEEQAAFRALSTFAGGFDLAAADDVAKGEGRGTSRAPSPLAPPSSLLDLLGGLVDKSLVVVEQVARGRRYRLLEPVRQYAHRLLVAADEDHEARSSHAAHYAALAERAAPMLHGPEQIAWLDRLEAERDNLRAALEWITAHGEIDDGLRLAVAMTPYWEARSYLSEGRRWLDVLLAKSPVGGASPAIRMQALKSAGALAQWQGRLEEAEQLLVGALDLARSLADRRSEAETLAWLVAVCRRHGAAERALSLSEESVRLGREIEDQAVLAFALLNRGVTLTHYDQPELAAPLLEECLDLYHRRGDTRYVALAAMMLGWAMLQVGDLEQSDRLFREGGLALRAVGDRRFLFEALAGIARVAEAQGELARAVTWLGAADGLIEELGMSILARKYADHLSFRASLQHQLTAARFDELYAAGKAISLDQVIADLVAGA